MKIAIVAPVLRKISTKNSYGGIERIIVSLTIGALDAGHKVVLYAPYGTDLEHANLKIITTTSQDVSKSQKLIKEAEQQLFQRIVDDQNQFDVIHSHIEPVIATKIDGTNYFDTIQKPIVITMHNQTYINDNIAYYKSHQNLHNINFVFISHDQSIPLAFLPNKRVIYNGINLSGLTFNDTPNKDQLAFLGRITPEKGIYEAIQIAKLSNKKLLIGAAIDNSQQDFYNNIIKPEIDNKSIIYLGELSDKDKNNLLRTSEALLFPIRWHEPFGLVMVEAMATGTPVIASNIGSVPEIIENDRTGYTIKDIDNLADYAQKIGTINSLDRKYCRQVAEEKFSEKIMVDKYLKLYKSII